MAAKEKRAPVICVPSGNFGNICAGILAHFEVFLQNILLQPAMPMMLFLNI
jgi:threonine synthase